MIFRHRLLCSVAVAAGLAGAAPPASSVAAPLHKHPTAVGADGAVASENLPATRAGLAVLRRGGSAADAAVAVASTLGVSDPYVAGIGGGGYFVYYNAHTRHVYTIDGRETAPASATASLFIDPATGQPLSFPT
ncbi:MAG: gamma-glutamyltransferase, partial [Solirubrobacteraceae bacterium]